MKVSTAEATALLIGARGQQAVLSELVADLGFVPVWIGGGATLPANDTAVSLCLVDLRAGNEALRAIRLVRAQHPRAAIIGIANPDRPAAAADAIRAGAFDVLPSPASARDLESLMANASEQRRSDGHLPEREPGRYGLVGASPAMQPVIQVVERAATGRSHVLIVGERGTGRSVVARAIHDHGRQPQAPFVTIDCSALSPEELELALFGNVNRRSASAPERRSLERVSRHSHVVDATGGTLHLEQIAEMPARVQSRLARLLRDREVLVGNERQPFSIDIRAVVSADTSIEAAVEEGRLRRDLYVRLSSLRIDVPPLRLRREDIPLLASHLIKDSCRGGERPLKTLTRPALTLLSAMPWRGNAPELRALIDRLVTHVPGGLIRLEDVLAHTQLEATASPTGCDATLRQARARFERDYIATVLQHHHGRMAEAARTLGIQRTNLYRKVRRLNVARRRNRGPEA